MVYSKDIPFVKAAMRECLNSRKELIMEFRIKTPDQTLRWILTRANLLVDKNGEIIEMSGISLDISERKFKEQLIRENEERFRALVQNALDIITIFNADGTITYQSDSIEKILGYSAKERIGQNLYGDSIVDPRDQDKEVDLIQKCIGSPYLAFQEELRMLTKEGELKIMEVSCINLLENASIRGIIKNYRDVTERRMIEKQKEEFIGVASHELKTPVTSIKAYAQILQDIFTERNDMQTAGLLQKMDRQLDRLTNLIKDLLDVTKITEGKLEIRLELIDLNALIDQAVEDMQPTTKRHEIIKNVDKTVSVLGDSEKIYQVFVNLLSNAIKYSPNADKIIINTEVKNGEIMVCIKDYGIGISREIQKNLFNRFYRVIDESTRTFPGLGLGLYISAEIIKRHKGKIWVESSLGEGASFCFNLPILDQ
jgi:PAS domain S-box-containing protein